MTIRDLLKGQKPDVKVDYVILNQRPDIRSAEEFIDQEIEGLNPVINNGRLQMQIWLKDKVRFSIEMED